MTVAKNVHENQSVINLIGKLKDEKCIKANSINKCVVKEINAL